MRCPECGVESRKARLDVYFCEEHGAWLIPKLSYESLQEASLTWEELHKEARARGVPINE